MEMKQEVHIKTVDAEVFFKITVGGKISLFDAGMRKVAVLQSMARRDKNIYAFIHLAEAYKMIDSVLMALDEQIKQFKMICEKKMGDISKVEFPVKRKIKYGFSNAVHGGLIQVIEKLDDCISFITLAKNRGAFAQQDTFFSLKNRLKDDCFRLFSDLIHIKTRDMPRVTINHYLTDDEIYLTAVARLGPLDPKLLHNAICSSVTPDISKKELGRISVCLRKKMDHVVKPHKEEV